MTKFELELQEIGLRIEAKRLETLNKRVAMLKVHGCGLPESHVVGGGEWSLEIFGEDGEYLFELVGSNGTCGPATDLYGELEAIKKIAFA